MDIITRGILTEAIKNVGFSKEAKNIAEMFLDYFGYDDKIIDNDLNNEERKVFYALEGKIVERDVEINRISYKNRYWNE